jgi:hypothetical protein
MKLRLIFFVFVILLIQCKTSDIEQIEPIIVEGWESLSIPKLKQTEGMIIFSITSNYETGFLYFTSIEDVDLKEFIKKYVYTKGRRSLYMIPLQKGKYIFYKCRFLGNEERSGNVISASVKDVKIKNIFNVSAGKYLYLGEFNLTLKENLIVGITSPIYFRDQFYKDSMLIFNENNQFFKSNKIEKNLLSNNEL